MTLKVATQDASGNAGTARDQDYFFQGSGIYKDAEFAKRTGITHITADQWEGNEPLIPVSQLIQSGKAERVYITYKSGTGSKRASLLVAASKRADIYSGDNAKQLQDLTWKILKAGNFSDKGKILQVGGKTTANFT